MDVRVATIIILHYRKFKLAKSIYITMESGSVLDYDSSGQGGKVSFNFYHQYMRTTRWQFLL